MSVIPTIRRKREGSLGKREILSVSETKQTKIRYKRSSLNHSLRFQLEQTWKSWHLCGRTWGWYAKCVYEGRKTEATESMHLQHGEI